jgi:hypothetical protein
MAIIIGPKFVEELQAAGLLGLPFAWGDDGVIMYDTSMTPVQVAAVQAVLAAHNPSAPATDRDDLRDAYVAAKAAIQTMAANAAIPADARNAVAKLGLCVEELLKYLNKRIA